MTDVKLSRSTEMQNHDETEHSEFHSELIKNLQTIVETRINNTVMQAIANIDKICNTALIEDSIKNAVLEVVGITKNAQGKHTVNRYHHDSPNRIATLVEERFCSHFNAVVDNLLVESMPAIEKAYHVRIQNTITQEINKLADTHANMLLLALAKKQKKIIEKTLGESVPEAISYTLPSSHPDDDLPF